MTRAEEAALKAYPVKEAWQGNQYGSWGDVNTDWRAKYQEGYEQSEKDLALTVDDIEIIDQIMLDLSNAYATGNFEFEQGSDEFYQETLKRFQEFKARQDQYNRNE